ncbi:hypothetical protein DKX38_001197 [Salix brachista]|uniref:carbamoyl-phosphate synthase (glutamine-hydrolyzing) n=1 Tax=Salix brachista TaxID=2182728 RepID=A0A5N5P502_9ROSI|nr:hypothetical protein DKX38_001197 [Salix brachista]
MELAIKNRIAPTTQNFLTPKPKVKSLRVFSVKCITSLSSSDVAATGVADRPWKTSDARLVLEDGSVWRAKSFGARGTQVGEVVFNTSLTGTKQDNSHIFSSLDAILLYGLDRKSIQTNVCGTLRDRQGHFTIDAETLSKGTYDANLKAIQMEKADCIKYQEILTDPSYAGQFVLMTNPHIGNTGVNFDDEESRQCFLAVLVIRSLSISTSNWRCTKALGDYLLERNLMGIYDVDTRAITRRLRQDGSLIGVLTTEESKTDEELLEMSRSWDIVGIDLISGVTCTAPYEWVDKTDPEWDFNCEGRGDIYHVSMACLSLIQLNIFAYNLLLLFFMLILGLKVIAYDFGIKHNILRRLSSYGCKITVVPSNWPASETLKMKPDGVLFSNGPGDPSAAPYAVKTVKELLGNVPVFGICMGHQLLGQALGGKTFKMKFGHHGGNHPVCKLVANRVEISAQNHNYAVDPASLPKGVEVTHINLNDGSCAGLAFPVLNVMSLQYHPEASPGPHDSDSVFGEFIKLMKEVKQKA